MGFVMTVSLPRDLRYVTTARLIAAQSAQECGCPGESAEAFAGHVEDEARKQLSADASAPHVQMGVERTPDALVVTIDSRVMRLTLS